MDLNPLAALISGRARDLGSRVPVLRMGVTAAAVQGDRVGTVRVVLDGATVPDVSSLAGPIPAGVAVWLLVTAGNALVLGRAGGPKWVPYAPAVTQNGVTVPVNVGYARWVRDGDVAHAQGIATVSGAGPAPAAVVVSLPVNAAGVSRPLGVGEVHDVDVARVPCSAVLASSSTIAFRRTDAPPTGWVGQSPSVQLAVGDTIAWDITYQPAY